MGRIEHMLNKEKWIKILKDHRDKYGFDKQITILGEECTELAKAVFKIKRYRENNPLKDFQWLKEDTELWNNFIEEYLDVYIMIKEFEPYINPLIAYQILDIKYQKGYNRINYKDES